MLHTNNIHVRDVEKIGRSQVRRQVLLHNFESHLSRIIVTAREIIDRHDEALHRRKLRRHRAAQVRRECGNTALSRWIIAEECNFANIQ